MEKTFYCPSCHQRYPESHRIKVKTGYYRCKKCRANAIKFRKERLESESKKRA